MTKENLQILGAWFLSLFIGALMPLLIKIDVGYLLIPGLLIGGAVALLTVKLSRKSLPGAYPIYVAIPGGLVCLIGITLGSLLLGLK